VTPNPIFHSPKVGKFLEIINLALKVHSFELTKLIIKVKSTENIPYE